jgi:hypothetical protein
MPASYRSGKAPCVVRASCAARVSGRDARASCPGTVLAHTGMSPERSRAPGIVRPLVCEEFWLHPGPQQGENAWAGAYLWWSGQGSFRPSAATTVGQHEDERNLAAVNVVLYDQPPPVVRAACPLEPSPHPAEGCEYLNGVADVHVTARKGVHPLAVGAIIVPELVQVVSAAFQGSGLTRLHSRVLADEAGHIRGAALFAPRGVVPSIPAVWSARLSPKLEP